MWLNEYVKKKGFNMTKLILIGVMLPLVAFGVDTTPLPDSAFWAELLKVLGGIKSMGVAAAVVAFTQLAMVFFRTEMSNFAGKWKLVVVLGLSVVFSIAGGIGAGLSLSQSLFSGATLSALQVFAFEFYKHWTDKDVPV